MFVPIFPSRPSKPLYLIVMLNLSIVVDSIAGDNATNNYSTESKKSELQIEKGRYLVFPTPGTFAPTKVQLIIGLGLPMEVDFISMIVGYVMKFNYVLPYNASYLTHPYGIRYDRSIDPRSIFDFRAKEVEEEEEQTKKGIPIAEQAEEKRRGSASRWEMYRAIESALDSFQVSGKGCLLKTICQLAEVPFESPRSAGLVAQLIHVLLTPSTTWDKYHVSGDQEYHSAEVAGRNNPGKCESLFHECDHNFLEYFTEINDIEQLVASTSF